MTVTMTENSKRLSTSEVAERAGVSRTTLLRWLKTGKVVEPDLDRNGWRAWTEEEARAISEFANRIVPHPRKRQESLDLKP